MQDTNLLANNETNQPATVEIDLKTREDLLDALHNNRTFIEMITDRSGDAPYWVTRDEWIETNKNFILEKIEKDKKGEIFDDETNSMKKNKTALDNEAKMQRMQKMEFPTYIAEFQLKFGLIHQALGEYERIYQTGDTELITNSQKKLNASINNFVLFYNEKEALLRDYLDWNFLSPTDEMYRVYGVFTHDIMHIFQELAIPLSKVWETNDPKEMAKIIKGVQPAYERMSGLLKHMGDIIHYGKTLQIENVVETLSYPNTRIEFPDNFNINTFEEYISIRTLLHNSIRLGATFIQIEMIDENGFKSVRIYDNIPDENRGMQWPPEVVQEFLNEYEVGKREYFLPGIEDKRGATIISYLSGQREALLARRGVPIGQRRLITFSDTPVRIQFQEKVDNEESQDDLKTFDVEMKWMGVTFTS